MTIYRKIYEEYYGPIPVDSDGRTYEIHHIDGNKANNHINNLKCVSIQEHYDIHNMQEDYGACYLIKLRMNYTPEEISELASKQNLKRVKSGNHHFTSEFASKREYEKVKKGIHPFVGGQIQQKTSQKRVEEKTHNFLGKNNPNQERIQNKTHNFLGPNTVRQMIERGLHVSQKPESLKILSEKTSKIQKELVKNGKHHLLSGEIQTKSNKERVEKGTHNFLSSNPNHPSKQKHPCPYCGIITNKGNLKQFHYEKCKNYTIEKCEKLPLNET